MWTADYTNDASRRINSAFDAGTTNALGSIGQARDAFSGGMTQATGAVNTGADAALGRLGEAASLYRPAYDRGENASGMLASSLGLNGAEGNQAAVNAFQAGPGYQWQRDQATDAAARKASALGIAGSGNTLAALASLGSNLANQEYGGWQNRLQGLGQMGQQAAGGIASALTGQAGIDMQRGTTLAGLGTQNANNIAGTFRNEADIYSNDAQNRANAIQWQAGQIIPAGQAGMMAGQNAAANRMNATMQGVNLGAQLLGSFMGAPTGGGGSKGTGGVGNMGWLSSFAGT